MSLTAASLKNIPISYASCSIGCKDEHTLPKRIAAIANAGFTGMELSFPDIQAFARQHLKEEVGEWDFEKLASICKVIKAMTNAKKLEIMLLQPFANFEGWPKGSKERENAFKAAKGWISMMDASGCKTLQVGSTDTPEEKLGDLDRSRFVADVRELGQMLAEKGYRLAYENWCWSTHAPDWADVWDIVKQVDLPNVGLCLDTFQTAGGEWGDPTTDSGLIEDVSKEELENRFAASMKKLSETIPADKIFLLQISDAYKPARPIQKTPDEDGLRPRGQWSHDYRPIPFSGGYLPVVEVAKAVLKTGFRGWFSYEVFDGGKDGKGLDYELDDYATKAESSFHKLMEACQES